MAKGYWIILHDENMEEMRNGIFDLKSISRLPGNSALETAERKLRAAVTEATLSPQICADISEDVANLLEKMEYASYPIEVIGKVHLNLVE